MFLQTHRIFIKLNDRHFHSESTETNTERINHYPPLEGAEYLYYSIIEHGY